MKGGGRRRRGIKGLPLIVIRFRVADGVIFLYCAQKTRESVLFFLPFLYSETWFHSPFSSPFPPLFSESELEGTLEMF